MGVKLPIQNYFKPKTPPSDWVRAIDWPVITDTANEVKMLVADTDLANFTLRTNFVKNSGINMYIDWGDGSPIDTISVIGLTLTSHQYVIGTGTPCSRGYTTFVIRIYADPTSVISFCQPIAPTITSSSLAYTMGLLEVYYGNGTVNTSAPNYAGVGSAGSIVGGFGLLEYVKLPQSVGWTSGMGFMFSQNQSIQKVILPTTYTGGVMDFRHFFSGCVNLRGEYTIPSSPLLAGAQLEATFSNCYNITKVTLPTNLSSLVTFNATFTNCLSLKNLTIPSIPLVTGMASLFDGCRSLEWVRFVALPSPAGVTNISFANGFRNCVSLENVYFPSTCSSNARYDASLLFINCSNLRTMIFPLGFNCTNINSIFNLATSITLIKFQNAFSACTAMTSAFSNCRALYDLTLPSSLGGVLTSANDCFTGCISLTNITIPNTYNFTGSINSMFSGNALLKTVTLPNTTQNRITTMNSTFLGCFALETVVLPSSMTGATDMSNFMSDCNSLKSVVLPTTMNSVTSMASAFLNCYSLESITMPTSMSSCNNFNSTFIRNKKLTTITMPVTVGTGTNWITIFFGCSSLKTITLPTTQTTTLTSLNQFIELCGSLTSITNVDKLGSLGATPLVNITQNTLVNMLPSLSFRCPMSIFALNGSLGGNVCLLNSLRFLNTSSGQWTGTSPQINVSFTSLSTAALVTLFNDMAAQGAVVGKTINITSATGAAGLTPANRAIITSIGWTIVG